jgi:hypothetical protein
MSGTGRSQRPGQLTVGRVGAIGARPAWDAQRPPQSVIPLRCLSLGRLPRSCAALIPGSTGGLT